MSILLAVFLLGTVLFLLARSEIRTSELGRRTDLHEAELDRLRLRLGAVERDATPPRAQRQRETTTQESPAVPMPTPAPQPEPVRMALPPAPPSVPSTPPPASRPDPRPTAPAGSEPRTRRRSGPATSVGSGPSRPRRPEPGRPGPPPPPAADSRWEERIGTRLAVWVGAVALALAGLFLVRYMHQQGWVSPSRRVLGAAAFGLILLGAGEWTRRSFRRLAQGATAAGVAVLFGTVLAATQIYGFLPPAVGFLLLALLTGVAVVSSLRQGPLVAVLGLVGGFLTPGLIGIGHVSSVQLFGYLFLLEAGLMALTRKRSWWWLGLLTLAGGLGWAAIWMVFFRVHDPGGAAWVGLYLLLSISVFVTTSIRSDQTVGRAPVATLIPWVGVAAGLVLVAWLLGSGEQTNLEWAYMGLLGAGALVLARRHERFFGLAILGSSMPLVLLALWALHGVAHGESTRFTWIAAALALVFCGGPYASLWVAARPARWATMSVSAAIVVELIAHEGLRSRMPDFPWWMVSLAGGALFALLSLPVVRRRAQLREGNAVLALLLAGTSAFVALAIPQFVNRYHLGPQWMTVAWALMVPAVLFLAGRLRVPSLRRVGTALAVLVAVRLLLNPFVLLYDIGTRPVLNWLAYGYGVPLVAFVAVAMLLRKQGATTWLVRGFDLGAIALGFAMTTLMVRHGFHPTMIRGGWELYELATYAIVWALLAGGLMVGGRRSGLEVGQPAGEVVGALSLVMALLGVGGIANPLWSPPSSAVIGGGILLNGLLYAVALPTALAGSLAWLCRRARRRGTVEAFESGTVAMVLLTLALFVRHGFHPSSMLLRSGGTLYEAVTLSLGWFGVASILLAVAGRSGSPWAARLAGIVLLAGLQVFLLGPMIVLNPLWNAEAARAVGRWPLFNGLLYALLAPTVAAALLAWQARRGRLLALAGTLERAAFLLSLLTLSLILRHAFHVEDMRLIASFSLVEVATYGVVWLAAGVLVLVAHGRWPTSLLRTGGRTLLGLGAVVVTLGSLGIFNPLLAHQSVGPSPVLNWLLYVYGAPAILLGLAVPLLARRGETVLARTASLGTLILWFVLITFEVRQAFHGEFLDGDRLLKAESYGFSAAWVLFAVALLLLGIGTGSRMIRHASLAVMVLSAAKVFLFDTRHLEDLYRVMSFLGLGLSLFGVAYVYQRFVFRPREKAAP